MRGMGYLWKMWATYGCSIRLCWMCEVAIWVAWVLNKVMVSYIDKAVRGWAMVAMGVGKLPYDGLRWAVGYMGVEGWPYDGHGWAVGCMGVMWRPWVSRGEVCGEVVAVGEVWGRCDYMVEVWVVWVRFGRMVEVWATWVSCEGGVCCVGELWDGHMVAMGEPWAA